MVEADEDEKIMTPGATVPRQIISSTARRRHETANKRFMHFGVLSLRFRHDYLFHRDCFVAVAVITEIILENGEPFFSV